MASNRPFSAGQPPPVPEPGPPGPPPPVPEPGPPGPPWPPWSWWCPWPPDTARLSSALRTREPLFLSVCCDFTTKISFIVERDHSQHDRRVLRVMAKQALWPAPQKSAMSSEVGNCLRAQLYIQLRPVREQQASRFNHLPCWDECEHHRFQSARKRSSCAPLGARHIAEFLSVTEIRGARSIDLERF